MDWLRDFLETSPLLAVGLSLLAVFILATEVGRLLRRLAERRHPDTDDSAQSDWGYIVPPTLGLLALLIGFTFSLALSRHDERRLLVVDEANAIGTTWLRVQLLDEPERTQLSNLLVRYADLRLRYCRGESKTRDGDVYDAAVALQTPLWTLAGAAARREGSNAMAAQLIAATNESIDLAAASKASRDAVIPFRVLCALLLYATLSAVLLGYVTSSHHRGSSITLMFLLALALTIILDLDRPGSGGIQVSAQPMADLAAAIAPRDAGR